MVIVMVLLLILATFPHINKCSGSKKLPRGDQVLLTTFLVISIIAGWYLPQLSSLHCQRCIAGWYLHCHNCHSWTGRAIGQSCHQSWYLPLFPTLPRLNRKHAVNEEPQRDIGSLEQFFVHCLCLFVRLPARSMKARSIRWVVHCHTPLFLFLFQLSSLHRPPHSSTAHHPRNELSTKKSHCMLFLDGFVHICIAMDIEQQQLFWTKLGRPTTVTKTDASLKSTLGWYCCCAHWTAAKCPQQMVAGSSGKRLEPSRPTKDPPDLTHHGSLPSEQAQPALGLLASSQLYHLDLCLSLAPDNQQKNPSCRFYWNGHGHA